MDKCFFPVTWRFNLYIVMYISKLSIIIGGVCHWECPLRAYFRGVHSEGSTVLRTVYCMLVRFLIDIVP